MAENVKNSHVLQTACALTVLSEFEGAKSNTVFSSHQLWPADMQQIECFCMCATHRLGAVHHVMQLDSWLFDTNTEQIAAAAAAAAEEIESMTYLSSLQDASLLPLLAYSHAMAETDH